MIDPKKIEQFARRFHEFIPKGIVEFGNNIEKKIYQMIQAQLIRLDLVSRKEFDLQVQTLLHIYEKIASLECRINELEIALCKKKQSEDEDSIIK